MITLGAFLPPSFLLSEAGLRTRSPELFGAPAVRIESGKRVVPFATAVASFPTTGRVADILILAFGCLVMVCETKIKIYSASSSSSSSSFSWLSDVVLGTAMPSILVLSNRPSM